MNIQITVQPVDALHEKSKYVAAVFKYISFVRLLLLVSISALANTLVYPYLRYVPQHGENDMVETSQLRSFTAQVFVHYNLQVG